MIHYYIILAASMCMQAGWVLTLFWAVKINRIHGLSSAGEYCLIALSGMMFVWAVFLITEGL
jgi:hypothetical protein